MIKEIPLSSSDFRCAAFALVFTFPSRFSACSLVLLRVVAYNFIHQCYFKPSRQDFCVAVCVRSFLLHKLLLIVRVCGLFFVICCDFFEFSVFVRLNMIL